MIGKFYWLGSSEGQVGVGVYVAEKSFDKVLKVKSVCERILVLTLMLEQNVMNVVSVYVMQVRRLKEDKEDFHGCRERFCWVTRIVKIC